MKKTILSVLLLVVLCFSFVLTAQAELPESEYDGFLYDNASLLSQDEAELLEALLANLSDTYDAQVVVVTVAEVTDGSVDQFVETLYDSCDFGYGENRDGVLLLICMNPREYRILSNGYAGSAISTSVIDRIGDAIVSDLSAGNYFAAFREFTYQCNHYLDGYLNGFPFAFFKNLIISLVIGWIIAFIVTGVWKRQLKSVRRQPAATQYTKPDSMQLTASNDYYLYSTVSSRKREKSSSSGSSGSSRSVGGGKF